MGLVLDYDRFKDSQRPNDGVVKSGESQQEVVMLTRILISQVVKTPTQKSYRNQHGNSELSCFRMELASKLLAT